MAHAVHPAGSERLRCGGGAHRSFQGPRLEPRFPQLTRPQAVGNPDATSVAPASRPVTSCRQAVARAKQVLRQLRDARKPLPDVPAPTPDTPVLDRLREQARQQIWARIDLPLPVKASMLTSTGAQGDGDLIRMSAEADWPGGMVQRFRALRPLVESLLEGYDYQFLGLLESDADGVGLWSTQDMTIIGGVTNATFPSLLKLLEGGYGTRVTQPGHTVLAVNCAWTNPQAVGQPWDRALRDKAALVMGPTGAPQGTPTPNVPVGSSGGWWSPCSQWECVYVSEVVRSSKGATGLLQRTWPGPWQLYATPLDDAREVGPLLSQWRVRPPPGDIASTLQQSPHLSDMQRRAQQLREEEKQTQGGRWPWG